MKRAMAILAGLFLTVSMAGQNEESGYRLKSTPFSSGFLANAVDQTTAQTLLGGPFGGGSSSGDAVSVNGTGVTDADLQDTLSVAWTATGSGPAAVKAAFTQTATLAGDPALLANGICFGTTGLIFEGATADTFEGLLTVTDPTADRTWTLPNRSGTVSLSGDTFTGDVTGTLNSSGATALTIAADAVALGTDTTGNYVANVASGAGLSGGSAGSESAALTLLWAPDTFVNNVTMWDASQASRTWTFNLSGATDPVWTIGNNSVDLTTGVLKQGGTSVALQSRALTVAGTANEITSSAGSQDLSADRTWTLSLPSALTFTGKTITGGSFSSPTITTPTVSGAIVFPDGVRQTFNPDGTTPGLSVGSQAGDPSTPANGDLWYDSSGQLLRARINGATVSLGSGGTTVNSTGGPLYVATADGTVANTTTETTLFGSGVGTKTLPANYLAAGKTIQVRLRGRVGTKTVSPGTLTVKLKLGSTVIWSAAISYPASLANDYAEFLGHITCRTTGASGTVFAQGYALYNDGVTTTVNAPISANTTTSTIDTTATQVVDVTATWATADPANTITASIATIDDGSGGSVTATAGSLTANAVVLGAGSTDTKVSSSITTDGSAKVTLGTLDLGNTTDTTLSRSAAGVLAVEGVDQVNVNRTATVAGTSLDIVSSAGAQDLSANRTWTLSLDRTATLAGNPALAASAAAFATTGIIFEGATADTFEGLLATADPTADRTWTLPDADTKIPISSQVLTFAGPTAARTITFPDAAITVARTDAANTFTGTQTITQIDVGNTDTSITRSAAGVIAVEGVDVVNTSTTQTLTGKTFDSQATGNVLKTIEEMHFDFPHQVDNTGTTRVTTEGATYGHATFSNSADKAGNYIIYRLRVPFDLDTAVDLSASFTFRLGGADTGKHAYEISMADVADSAGADAPTFSNAIALNFAGDASGASADVETVAYTTLTTWKSSLTAGHIWVIKLARDGDDGTNDTSTVNSTDVELSIKYGRTQ